MPKFAPDKPCVGYCQRPLIIIHRSRLVASCTNLFYDTLLFPDDSDFTVLTQSDDAGRLVGLMLLTAAPADVVDGF